MPFLIYMTFSDKPEAEKIASALLEKKLIACANIFAPHTSIYEWEGEVKSDEEIAGLFKTEEKHFEEIERVVKSLHSYDTPCIIGWKTDKSNVDFSDWVKEQVK